MIIAIIGLGYVGEPLAVELGKHFPVIGYDINIDRIEELQNEFDRTEELTREQIKGTSITYTYKAADLLQATIFIIAVPTPIREGNVPHLEPIKLATRTVAHALKPNDIVIYESTVYPGVTEEICVPILEKESGLRWKQHFFVGYSPERINPGDKIHTLTSTTKIVSGDSEQTLDHIDHLYSKITSTYRAPSIRVAEAAKVIENIQRDVNIALMNELSQIFQRLNIDTNDVIDAASSKWNFQTFRPGLVGGHCISVDPYYLSHKAATQGFIADVILSAREVNDSMAAFVVDQLIRMMARNRMLGGDPVVTILGCTFKENVPDIRNSKVFQIVEQLRPYGIIAQVIDPHASAIEVRDTYRVRLEKAESAQPADAIILAVPHSEFKVNGWKTILEYGKGDEHELVVMDIPGVLDRVIQPTNIDLWRA
jgi:UDP-N-acetyl-D-galactosamine dehydrogenase